MSLPVKNKTSDCLLQRTGMKCWSFDPFLKNLYFFFLKPGSQICPVAKEVDWSFALDFKGSRTRHNEKNKFNLK